MSIYQFSASLMNGEEKSLADYTGDVILIVNTATKCGFSSQFEGLEELYNSYKDQGFNVLGFPCNQFKNQEPGTNEEVAAACQLNHGVSFPLFEKVNVKGEEAHPLFKYLTEETKGLLNSEIKWNFTKFLIDREGNVVNRYAPVTTPKKIEKDIRELLF